MKTQTLYKCPNTGKIETLAYWHRDFRERQQYDDEVWWDFEAHMSTFIKMC